MVDAAFPTPVLFPGETTPAVADLVITVPIADSQLEVSLDESKYLLIVFDNQDTVGHGFLLVEKSVAHIAADVPENSLAATGGYPGQLTQLAIAGLPAGEYVIIDFREGREFVDISLTIQ